MLSTTSFRAEDPRVHDLRVCPGRHIGEDFLFTAVARTIALFNISPGDETSGGVPVAELGKTCVFCFSPACRTNWN